MQEEGLIRGMSKNAVHGKLLATRMMIESQEGSWESRIIEEIVEQISLRSRLVSMDDVPSVIKREYLQLIMSLPNQEPSLEKLSQHLRPSVADILNQRSPLWDPMHPLLLQVGQFSKRPLLHHV